MANSRTAHWSPRQWKQAASRDLQKAIRAEAGALVGPVPCVIRGEIESRYAALGMVVCVTCGKTMPWSAKGTHAGHFLGGRCNAILFDENGIHPQCYSCNKSLSGNQGFYRIYMDYMYGPDEIDRLTRLKNGPSKQFPIGRLNYMRELYRRRWKTAVTTINGEK